MERREGGNAPRRMSINLRTTLASEHLSLPLQVIDRRRRVDRMSDPTRGVCCVGVGVVEVVVRGGGGGEVDGAGAAGVDVWVVVVMRAERRRWRARVLRCVRPVISSYFNHREHPVNT